MYDQRQAHLYKKDICDKDDLSNFKALLVRQIPGVSAQDQQLRKDIRTQPLNDVISSLLEAAKKEKRLNSLIVECLDFVCDTYTSEEIAELIKYAKTSKYPDKLVSDLEKISTKIAVCTLIPGKILPRYRTSHLEEEIERIYKSFREDAHLTSEERLNYYIQTFYNLNMLEYMGFLFKQELYKFHYYTLPVSHIEHALKRLRGEISGTSVCPPELGSTTIDASFGNPMCCEVTLSETIKGQLSGLWLRGLETEAIFIVPATEHINVLLVHLRFVLSVVPLKKFQIECPVNQVSMLAGLAALALLFNRSVESIIINGQTYNYQQLIAEAQPILPDILTRFKRVRNYFSSSPVDEQVLEFPEEDLLACNAALNTAKVLSRQSVPHSLSREEIATWMATIGAIGRFNTPYLQRYRQNIAESLRANVFGLFRGFKEANIAVDSSNVENYKGMLNMLFIMFLHDNQENSLIDFQNLCDICVKYPEFSREIAEPYLKNIEATRSGFYEKANLCLARLSARPTKTEETVAESQQRHITALSHFFRLTAETRKDESITGAIEAHCHALIELQPKTPTSTAPSNGLERILVAQHLVSKRSAAEDITRKIMHWEMLRTLKAIREKQSNLRSDQSLTLDEIKKQSLPILQRILGLSETDAETTWNEMSNFFKLPIFDEYYERTNIRLLQTHLLEAKALGVNFDAVDRYGAYALERAGSFSSLIPYLDVSLCHRPNSHSRFAELFVKLNNPQYAYKIYDITNIIIAILDSGKPINVDEQVSDKSLLQLACDANFKNVVEKLLGRGANPANVLLTEDMDAAIKALLEAARRQAPAQTTLSEQTQAPGRSSSPTLFGAKPALTAVPPPVDATTPAAAATRERSPGR